MVHDSRYDLQAPQVSATFSAAELAAGVDWADSFVSSYATKLAVGFRPTQVAAKVSLQPAGAGRFELALTDRSVYLSDDDANYRSQTKTHVFSNAAAERALGGHGPSAAGEPRPTSIDTFALDGRKQFGTSIVWTHDNNPVDWRLIVAMPKAAFLTEAEDLRKRGSAQSQSRAVAATARASTRRSSSRMRSIGRSGR